MICAARAENPHPTLSLGVQGLSKNAEPLAQRTKTGTVCALSHFSMGEGSDCVGSQGGTRRLARHGLARRGDLAGAVRCQLGEWLARRVFQTLGGGAFRRSLIW